ncbi:MAG: hypothetical protein ACK57V_10145, partial [Pirellula sp.]
TAFGVHDLHCNTPVIHGASGKDRFRKPLQHNILRRFRQLPVRCGTEYVMELPYERWSRLEPGKLSTNPERWI